MNERRQKCGNPNCPYCYPENQIQPKQMPYMEQDNWNQFNPEMNYWNQQNMQNNQYPDEFDMNPNQPNWNPWGENQMPPYMNEGWSGYQPGMPGPDFPNQMNQGPNFPNQMNQRPNFPNQMNQGPNFPNQMNQRPRRRRKFF